MVLNLLDNYHFRTGIGERRGQNRRIVNVTEPTPTGTGTTIGVVCVIDFSYLFQICLVSRSLNISNNPRYFYFDSLGLKSAIMP